MNDKLRGYEPPVRMNAGGPDTTFAFRPINPRDKGDRSYLDTSLKVSQMNSRDPWRFYHEIGEVHYAISRTARVAGYGKLVPQYIDRTGQVADKPSISTIDDITAGIYGKFGGTRGLLQRFFTLMKVPADGYLIRVRENDVVDGYWVCSPSEIGTADLASGRGPDLGAPLKWTTASVTGTNGDKTSFIRDIAPEDFLGRIWMPDPQYVDMADSALSAMEHECEELIMLTKAIKGRLQQRFALAGILLIPSELNDANIAGQKPGETPGLNKILNMLITLMSRNVQDHDQALAHIPAILMGPSAHLEAVRHVILDTMISDSDIQQRAELISRILSGLDVQKRQAQGGEGTSHWGAWADSEDERRIAVQPDGDTFAHVCTRAILHTELTKLNWQPEKIRRWRYAFDLTDASVKTNQGEDFRLGYDRRWVGEAAGRRIIGANDTDAPTPEERIRMTGIQLGNAYLATYGLDGKDGIVLDHDRMEASGKSKTGPNAEPGDSSGKAGPGVGQPGSPSARDSDTPKSKEPG